MRRHPSLLFIVVSTVTAILALGCGKKENEESDKPVRDHFPQVSDLEVTLNQQELICGIGRICPSYLTKIAIIEKRRLRYCTGFLTDANTVATASSCLPEYLRLDDQACDKDIYFFFAENNRRPIRVGCQKVLRVTQLDVREPYLWRSNIAFLRLERPMKNRTLRMSRSGMGDMEKFSVWSIDQINETQGIIRKTEDTVSVHNSYLNPIADDKYSPNMLLSGFDYSNGNSGAPIIDKWGQMRGIVSMPIEKKLMEQTNALPYMEDKLKSAVYSTNFSCAPSVHDYDVPNEVECFQELNQYTVDNSRKKLVSEERLFRPFVESAEKKANEKSRFLQLKVKIPEWVDPFAVNFYPVCFKNMSSWISDFDRWKPSRAYTDDFDLPRLTLRRSMDVYGRIKGLEHNVGDIETYFQFMPRDLKKPELRRSNVYVWDQGPSTKYPGISGNCPSLL